MAPSDERIVNIPVVPDEVKESAKEGTLVLFIGAGVSRIAGLPGWSKWSENVLSQLQEKDLINYAEIEQLKTLNPQTRLSITKIIAGKTLDLTSALKQENASKIEIYTCLNKIGCVYVTTNYDKLLAPKPSDLNIFSKPDKANETLPPKSYKRIYKREELLETKLRTPRNVIHLHGCIEDPESMVITISDYIAHYNNEFVNEFLIDLFAKYTVVFIGYSLEEIEILEYILKKGQVKNEEKIRKRFYLKGFFSYQEMLHKHLKEYYVEYFGVHLLGFKRDKNDFYQLVEILKKWRSEIQVNPPYLVDDLLFIDKVITQ